jgi:AraC family transcriptional regulator
MRSSQLAQRADENTESPGQCRMVASTEKNLWLPTIADQNTKAGCTGCLPNKKIIMKVTLIDRQPATVAYFRHLGPYGESIARFWQETYVPWAVMNQLGANHARYGVSHDDPGIALPGQCRYDACAEVSPDFVATGGALKTTIPGGKYAVLQFKGTVEQVGEAWTALLRDWLPSSGQQLDGRPCFEYYPKGAAFNGKTGAFECEICIPVIPL